MPSQSAIDRGDDRYHRHTVSAWAAFRAGSHGWPRYGGLGAALEAAFSRQTHDPRARIATRGAHRGLDMAVVARGRNAMIAGLWLDLPRSRSLRSHWRESRPPRPSAATSPADLGAPPAHRRMTVQELPA